VNNTVFIGSGDGNFYALDASTGLAKWTAALGNADINSPSIANGVVYVGELGGHLYGLDLATGAILWSAHTPYNIAGRPTIADGMLYIGSKDNSVYAFALDAGNNAAYNRSRTPPSYASLHPDFRLKPVK
jgi:outer membrane protein assembly factor BamB